MKTVFSGFLLKQVINQRVSKDHRNVLLKYYNNAVHVLYKTQEMRFSCSVSKDDGGKVVRCLHSHVKWLYSAIKGGVTRSNFSRDFSRNGVALKVECRVACYSFRLFAQCLARQRVASFLNGFKNF